MSEWISDEDWRTVVSSVPIASVDLVVMTESGGIVLGKRANEPAKGEWFVPGGRIRKMETREEAVHRIAEEELGISVQIERSLGAYEHIYHTSDIPSVETKHYLANGYLVQPEDTDFKSDSQHSRFKVFVDSMPDLHEYVSDYLEVIDPSLVS